MKNIPEGFIDVVEDLLPLADSMQPTIVFAKAEDVPRLKEMPEWLDEETKKWLEERKNLKAF